MALFNKKNQEKDSAEVSDLDKPTGEPVILKEEVQGESLTQPVQELPQEDSQPQAVETVAEEAEVEEVVDSQEVISKSEAILNKDVPETTEEGPSTDLVLKEMIQEIDLKQDDDYRLARLDSLNRSIENRLTEITIERDRIKTLKSMNETKHNELIEEVDTVKKVREDLKVQKTSLDNFEKDLERLRKENQALSERLTAEIVSAEESRLEADRLRDTARLKDEQLETDRSRLDIEAKELKEKDRQLIEREKAQVDAEKDIAEREVAVQAAEAMRNENIEMAKADREAASQLHSQAKKIKEAINKVETELSSELAEVERDRKHVSSLKSDAERILKEAEAKLNEASTKEKSAEVKEKASIEKEAVINTEFDTQKEMIENERKELEEKTKEFESQVTEAEKTKKDLENQLKESVSDLAQANDKIENLQNELETNKLAVNQLKLDSNGDLQSEATEALRDIATQIENAQVTDEEDLDRLKYGMEILLSISKGENPVDFLKEKTTEITENN